jgi:hypothetical protein
MNIIVRRWAVPVAALLAIIMPCCNLGGSDSQGSPKVSSNGRYLVDRDGKPFLMVGDAPQALMVNASLRDADFFLADRAARGFNTIWIMLLCNTYSGGRADASTLDGLVPFTTPGDLSTPNEPYFARCDEILRAAADHGLTVILDPIETGGFLEMMRANGIDKCRAYGRFLGNRYKDFGNLIWMSGSDFQTWQDDYDDSVVKAVALGIKERDRRHIHTLQLDYTLSSSLDNPNWADVIDINAGYTRFPVYAVVLDGYNHSPSIPVFVIEASYEDEHETDAERLRRQAYWTYLAGGCGHVFGNHYVWAMRDEWREHLDTIGAVQFGHCKALFEGRPWHELIPDQNHMLLTSGYGTYSGGGIPHTSISENDYATAAATANGKLAMIYIPSSRTVTIDLTRLSGPVTARWYDPTDGTYHDVPGSPLANTGSKTFSTPGAHADGASDWILVLEAS